MGQTLVSVENHIAEVAHITEASSDIPAYGRVSVFQIAPGSVDAVREKVVRDLAPVLRDQAGFIRFVVFRTGPESVFSFTGFASRDTAEAAATAIRAWTEANVGADIIRGESHAGEVIWSIRKD